ncbi:hypothetical protein [Polymorphobacter fuscus]|nr:hypothetical protein [Polymorphobacter fuscus]NJC08322.1 hypothetical protein [Polymorphobacter fuscus]
MSRRSGCMAADELCRITDEVLPVEMALHAPPARLPRRWSDGDYR